MMKEWGNRAIGVVSLLILAPLFAAIAIAVKLSSPGDVFYRAQRVGLSGRPFTMFKFRSLVAGAPAVISADKKMLVTKGDSRLTPIGSFLRLGFDELPQLLNVACGSMAIVGPRPDAVWILPRYSTAIRERLAAKPGITGLAQVLGARELTTAEGYALDAIYIRQRSWSLDAVLIAATVPYVLGWRSLPLRVFRAAFDEAVRRATDFGYLPESEGPGL
jgi:lipopolysaccharide/colanic/teichoic acid biosynthesis glycosyltransferase